MQIFRPDSEDANLVAWGVRVLMISDPKTQGTEVAMRRIAGFGGIIDHHDEFYTGLQVALDDLAGYQLFVMLCDDVGGLAAGQRAHGLLRGSGCMVPVILVSSECGTQIFPEDRQAAVVLRSPLSAVSLRVGFEHALRDRMLWAAA